MGTAQGHGGADGAVDYDVEPHFGTQDGSLPRAGSAPKGGPTAVAAGPVGAGRAGERGGGQAREAVVTNGHGVEFLRQGQYDEAIRQFTLALEYEQANVQILNNIGLAYAKKQDYAGAYEWFERAYSQDTKDIETLFSLAWVERKRHRFPQAKDLFLKVLSIQPDHVKTLYLLSDILMNAGHDHEGAARYLDRLIRLDASNVDGHISLGQCCEHMRQYPKAAKMYSTALQLAPNRNDTVFFLGRVYYLMNQFDKSITQFDRVPDTDSRGFEARTYAANACREINDRKRALANAERAARIRKHPDVMLFLGEEYAKQGDYQMAEVWLSRAVELDNDHMASLLELGQLMYKQSRWADAERHLARLCELDGNSVSAIRTLAQARHHQKKFTSCRSACEAALRLELLHPDTLWLLAECHRLGGSDGERWLLALRYPPELSVSVGDVCMAIAKSYLMRKQAAESLDWLQKAEHYLPSDKRVVEAKAALSRMASPEQVLEILERRPVPAGASSMNDKRASAESTPFKPLDRAAVESTGALEAVSSASDLDNPASLERLLWRAERSGTGLASERQWQEVLTHSRSAARKRPQDAAALRCVARALLALKGDLEEIRHFARCAMQSGAQANGSGFTLGHELDVYLAVALEREREWKLAEKHYRDALSSKPGDERAMLGLARTLVQQREMAKAKQLYEQVSLANPACVESALRLAELAVEVGEPNEAHRLATRALQLNPDDQAVRLCMAQACAKAGKLEEAARAYELALGSHSSDVALMFTLANLYERLGRDSDATRWFKRVLELRPTDYECNFGLAKIQAKRGAAGATQALQHFKSALQCSPNAKASFDISLQMVDVHRGIGAFREAQQSLETLMRDHPDSADIAEKLLAISVDMKDTRAQLLGFRRLERLAPLTATQRAGYGDALLADGRVLEARENLERAIREDPKNVAALLALGKCWRQDNSVADHLEKAVSFFEQVTALDATNTEALEGAAYCQRKLNNLEAAITLYQSCLKLRPTAEGPLYYLGDILYRLHRHNECQHNLVRLVATQCSEDYKTGAYYLLAKSHVSLDQYKEAEAQALAGLQMKPDHPHFLFILALVQNRLDDFDASIRSLNQALQNCTNEPSMKVDCQDWLAQAYERKHDYQKAMSHVDMALQLDPSHVSSLITKGLVHIQQKQLDQAETSLRRALAVEKMHSLALVRLGYCKLLANDYVEATQLFNKALQQRCGTVALPRSVKGTARVYLALTMMAQKDVSGAMFQIAEARKNHRQFDELCKSAKASILVGEFEGPLAKLLCLTALDVNKTQAWQLVHLMAKELEMDFQDGNGSSTAATLADRAADASGASRAVSTPGQAGVFSATVAAPEQRRWTAPEDVAPAASPDQRRWLAPTSPPPANESEQRRWTAATAEPAGPTPLAPSPPPSNQAGTLRLERHEQIDFAQLQQNECLGSGGFGAVYRGKFRGREVAIKKLFCEDAGSVSAMQLEELEKEVANLRSLTHPRLVAFIGACLKPPNLCIITEFMPNGSLHHLLHKAKQPLVLAQQTKLALQVCEGVVFLHIQRPPVVHRDLKSLNIVLDFELNAKLCDFGLTQSMEKTHISLKEGGNGGSPRYMAPECYDSKGKITEKVDVWALGCIVIECFGGPLPYDDCSNIQQIVAKVLVEKQMPYVPHHLPTGVRELVEACFNFDIERRSSAQDSLAKLRQLRLPVAD